MKYYAIGDRPVTILQKVTQRHGRRRKRVWLCRLPDGEERWMLYRDLARVTVKKEPKCNGYYEYENPSHSTPNRGAG